MDEIGAYRLGRRAARLGGQAAVRRSRPHGQRGAVAEVLRFKRGITWLNAVNDQVAGIGQMAVPGTPRDSLHILDALLNLDGGV
nr:Tn3 family transposase [Streptomyces rimosus]